MNIKHIFRWMAIGLLLCAMLSCVALAEEETTGGGLAVGIYVVNSNSILNNFDGTVPLIVDTTVAATSLSLEMEQVSLMICIPGQDGVVFHEEALTWADYAAVADAVQGINGVSMNQGNMNLRIDGLNGLVSALEETDADRKLLIMFTAMNEWSNGYTDALRDFQGDVLMVWMPANGAQLGIPEDLRNLIIISVDGYDSSVILQALSMSDTVYDDGDMVRNVTVFTPLDEAILLEAQSEAVVRRSILLIGEEGEVGDAPEDADYWSDRLGLMHFETGEGAPMEVPLGVTVYLVDWLDRYEISSFSAADSEGDMTVAKGSPVKVENEILRRSDSAAAAITDWQMSMVVTDAFGQTVEHEMSLDEGTGHYVSDIEYRKSGEYTYFFRAVSALGLEITGEEHQLIVTNAAPTATGDAIVLEIWQHSPLALDQSIDLYSYFTDDDPDTLSFYLDPPQSGIGIQKSTLNIGASSDENVSFTGVIIATDEEGETAELPLQTSVLDAQEALQGGTLKISPAATQVKKGEAIQVSAEYHFSELGQKYVDQLRKSELQDELLVLLQVGFVLKSSDGTAAAQETAQAQWNEDGSISFSASVPFPILSGQYALEGAIGQEDEKGEFFRVAEAATVEVINQPPRILKDHFEFALVLPDILGGDEQALRPSETMRLKDYVEGEAGEELTITLSDSRLLLYRDDERSYRLTDQATEGQAPVVAITWNVNGEAPTLTVALTKVTDRVELTLTVKDNDGAEADAKITLSGSVRLAHQSLFVFLAIAVAALIVGTILFVVIRQLLKPSLKQTKLELTLQDSRVYALPLDSWKKQRLTIWDAILYTGLPLVCDTNYEELEKVQLSAARKQQYAILRAKDSAVALVTEDGTELTGNQICIGLGEYVTLTINGTRILKLRIAQQTA